MLNLDSVYSYISRTEPTAAEPINHQRRLTCIHSFSLHQRRVWKMKNIACIRTGMLCFWAHRFIAHSRRAARFSPGGKHPESAGWGVLLLLQDLWIWVPLRWTSGRCSSGLPASDPLFSQARALQLQGLAGLIMNLKCANLCMQANKCVQIYCKPPQYIVSASGLYWMPLQFGNFLQNGQC